LARFGDSGRRPDAAGDMSIDKPADRRVETSQMSPVLVLNGEGRSCFVLVCDHASNRIPAEYADLGLSAIDRLEHIAWDPGALAVALKLSEKLDAPLVHSTVSRLVVDCNRAIDRPDLIAEISESTRITANEHVSPEERQDRIARFHIPYHAAIDDLLDQRAAAGQPSILVAVHSFTPIYHRVARRWPIGLIHGRDTGFTEALRDALAAEERTLDIGWNEPYAGLRGVTYTLEHHGDGRGIEASMIEIRNDEILEPSGIRLWADRLARCLEVARTARATPG
jgi:predicted N-formylglutamate amidohydrolase